MEREALKALVHEMEYVLACINQDKIPFDGDDFHEALRLGKEALAQPAQEQRPWVGLTNDEVNNFAAGCHLGKSVQGAIYEAEAKLKEKNHG